MCSMSITYLKGDATYPQTEGPWVIPHVVNTEGAWGAGFVKALSKRWVQPEEAYRRAARERSLSLGSVGFVQGVEPGLTVANMVAQVGYGRGPMSTIPLRYGALQTCLEAVVAFAKATTATTVHMPRIGCALARGRWSLVEPIIQNTLVKAGVPVYVYDVPGGTFNL